MDCRNLEQHVSFFASSGNVLSSETLAQISNSLTIAKHNNKFEKVLFWGKIMGVKEDYIIVQGISGKDELNEKTTLYSLNGNDWHLLSTPELKTQEDAMQIRGRFMGDPMHEYEQHELRRFGEGDEAQEDDMTISVKEEDRLASVIAKIDEEAMIVPRGSYLRTPAGQVYKNESFSGLSLKDAQKLTSWLHFYGPVKLPSKSLLEQADATAPIDFLSTAAEDVPQKSSWSIQIENGPGVDCALVKLRSLHWIGAEACHIPETGIFSRVYFGDGTKNINLPFMLPQQQ